MFDREEVNIVITNSGELHMRRRYAVENILAENNIYYSADSTKIIVKYYSALRALYTLTINNYLVHIV